MNSTERPHTRRVLKQVSQTIQRHRMFGNGEHVLVGVSGGPDSVALLQILVRLAAQWNLTIGVAHLNHCLRGEASDRDAAFVAELAGRLNLPCHLEAACIQTHPSFKKLSLEGAARQVRYEFFDRICRRHSYQKIATGHHQEDNAEMMLMFLFRGSGPAGFSGIPPVRDGKIVRPLIDARRNELVAFLNENELLYQIDQSNCDLRFLRNRIRHETIPYIQACCNPGIIETLNRFSRIVRSENEWVNGIIQPVYEKTLVREESHRAVLSIPEMTALPEAVRRRLIRTAILRIKGNLQRISFSHIEAALELADHRRYPLELSLPDGIRVLRERHLLTIYLAASVKSCRGSSALPRTAAFRYSVPGPDATVVISETGAVMKFTEIPAGSFETPDGPPHIAFLDMEKLKFPLLLRSIQPGDRFRPLGVNGSQKIKKYFIDHKIHRSERVRCPVLVSNSEVIWLAGHRIGSPFKVLPATRRVLRIEFFRPLSSGVA